MTNAFKEKLKRDEVVVVINPDHPSASLTEFVAGLGFDGVFIDCEHGFAGIERVQDMCRAARAAGVQSIVRPESDAPHLITRYLDAGAGGVMVPHVESAEAASRIVATVRYARPKDHADKILVAMISPSRRLPHCRRCSRSRGSTSSSSDRTIFPIPWAIRLRCIIQR